MNEKRHFPTCPRCVRELTDNDLQIRFHDADMILVALECTCSAAWLWDLAVEDLMHDEG